jgi:predicted Zn-dependent protease with MMP-like domain
MSFTELNEEQKNIYVTIEDLIHDYIAEDISLEDAVLLIMKKTNILK